MYAKFLDVYRKAAMQSQLRAHGIVSPAPQARTPVCGKGLWYTRHHFFRIAHATFKVKQLYDLTADDFLTCLKKCHQTLRDHPHLREGLSKGAGPASRDDIDDRDKLDYNGVGGGRFYPWYTKGAMQKELSDSGTNIDKCSEYEFEVALQRVSARLKGYPYLTQRLHRYAGPQSYADLDDKAKVCSGLINNDPKIGQADSGTSENVCDKLREHVSLRKWLRCVECGCSRLVSERSLEALTSAGFLDGRGSSEWQTWCHRNAVHRRYAAGLARNQQVLADLEDVAQEEFISTDAMCATCDSGDHDAELPSKAVTDDHDVCLVSSDDEEKLSLYGDDPDPCLNAASMANVSENNRDPPRKRQKHDHEIPDLGDTIVQFRCSQLQNFAAGPGPKWQVLKCTKDNQRSDADDLVHAAQNSRFELKNLDDVFVLPHHHENASIDICDAFQRCRVGRIMRVDKDAKTVGLHIYKDVDTAGGRLPRVKMLPIVWKSGQVRTDYPQAAGFWQVRLEDNRCVHNLLEFRDGAPCVDTCLLLPCHLVQPNVAKFDVVLRNEPLQAVRAMSSILIHMLKFRCRVCKEQFPTFHPAYRPPADLELHLLKASKRGVAACNIEVHCWDNFPGVDEKDASRVFTGRCLACQADIQRQLAALPASSSESSLVVPRRSYLNHMDPCFRFPEEELRQLFDGAVLLESMLIAQYHMQVNYYTLQKSRLHKFFKNVICFPQDIAGFARRTGLLATLRIGDRVNTVVPPGASQDAFREWKSLDPAEKTARAHDDDGRVIYAATIVETDPAGGQLKLNYDGVSGGGEPGCWWIPSQKVESRISMPWHPSKLSRVLTVMLRRNVGRGVVLEGMQVRWDLVRRLVSALTKMGRWHDTEDGRNTPMHWYYHPGLFDSQALDADGYYCGRNSERWTDAGNANGATARELEVLQVNVMHLDVDDEDAADRDAEDDTESPTVQASVLTQESL